MPYIPKDDRIPFEAYLQDIEGVVKEFGFSNGDLNYLITRICKIYQDKHGTSYNIIKDVVGALECAKLEYYARIARPYEDKKIKTNGDVYDNSI